MAIVRGTAATTLVTAATASWNPTLPTSSVGDLLLMWLCNESNPTMTTPPVGWTARGGRVVSGASDTESFVYYRFATGSDSAAHTLSSAQRGIAIVVPYTGVDATTPFDVATTHEAEASGTSWAPTGITPVTNGAELVSFIVADLSASFAAYFNGLTSPGPLSIISSPQESGGLVAAGFASGNQATAAAVAPTWTTSSGTADEAVSWLSALRPAAVAAATVPWLVMPPPVPA